MKSKLLTALFAAVAMLFVAGCSRTPSKTAEKYCAAIIQGKLDEANKYSLDDETKAMNAMAIEAAKDFKWGSAKVVGEKTSGDKSTVTVQLGNGKTDEVNLVKVGGEWKVKIGE